MFVKRVGDLQSTDERYSRNVLVAVIYQSHLGLEIIDVVLQALPGLHLNGEEVVAVLLELASRPRF